MKSWLRGAAAVVAAMSLAGGPAACGHPNPSHKGGVKIGLLLPDNQTARYETFDRPLAEKKIKELCSSCTVEYANAQGDEATQHQQMDSMITKGVEALILAPVNARSLRSSVQEAENAGVPVVSYDRLAEGPVSAYVTHDQERIGRIQGKALLQALGAKPNGGQIVMMLEGSSMGGSSTIPEVVLRTKGVLSALKGKVKIGKKYIVTSLSAGEANTTMSAAIAALGADGIDGVYAANDTFASGAISALKAANIKPLPPVTGQDADLAAVQRIIKGDQYMSVYKPYKPEADAAAEMAIALGRGERLDGIAQDKVSNSSTKDIPAVLLTSIPLTVGNIKDTVVKDGVYTIKQICSPKYQAACEKAGLTK